MKYAFTVLLSALALSLIGCDFSDNDDGMVYDITVYNRYGVETSSGRLELEYGEPFQPSDSLTIHGQWRWQKPLFADVDSGPLQGGIGFNRQIWISLQMAQYATDVGMDLDARFVNARSTDFGGHIYKTTIAGRQKTGEIFRARMR